MTSLALAVLLAAFQVPAQESEVDRLKKDMVRLKADYEARIAELNDRLLKADVQRKYGLATVAVAKDLAEVEKKRAEMARDQADLAEKLLRGGGFKVVAGKVTAVADQIGLVVLSVGSEVGVAEGDEFTITREGALVAKTRIDRVDGKWAVGKVSEQTGPPRVGDDAIRKDPRNAVPAPALKRSTADEVQSLRKELDDVRNQVRQLTDRLVPSYQGAGFSVEEAPEALRDHLGIPRGLVVRQVRAGSEAAKSGLKPNDVIPDLQEAQLVETLESGRSLPIIRQGLRMTLSARRVR
jgi:hypothetical protein